jgi:hypothetical protein
MIGVEKELNWEMLNNVFTIQVPFITVDELPSIYAYVFAIDNVLSPFDEKEPSSKMIVVN